MTGRIRHFLSRFFAELGPRQPTPRMLDLDAARGIAIFLVVLGHVVAETMPRDVSWYPALKYWIYRFHMPLFMVLTGVTFALSLPVFKSWGDVARFSWRKTSRLLVPYFFFGLLVLAGKLTAAQVVHVDNVPADPVRSALNLLLLPGGSAAGFLWFIYVLSAYFLFVPAFMHLFGRRPALVLLVGLILGAGVGYARFTDKFALGSIIYYLPWFGAGMVMWMWREHWQRLPLWPVAALVLPWFALGMWQSLNTRHYFPFGWAGVLSVPIVLGLLQHSPVKWQEMWAWVGQRSLAIYLMNTMMIGVTKAVYLKLMPWDGWNFLPYFVLALAAGTLVPLVVKATVERRFPALNNYV